MLYCPAVASFVREEDDSTSFYSFNYKQWSGIAQFAWETNEYLKVPMMSRATMSRHKKSCDRLVRVNNQIVNKLLDIILS